MQKMIRLFSLVSVAFLFAACGLSDDSSDGIDRAGPYQTTGIALTSDTLADTDIASMNFEVTRVRCSDGAPRGLVESKTVDFEQMYLPGGIGTFEDEPYDADSKHIFADSYFLVDAGCYDVKIEPMRSPTAASKDCSPAHKDGVRVRDGKTTEILLVSQCKGAKRGGLDVAGSINHAPEIDDLVFHDSKFIAACQPQTSVCVTASDPDSDPLEFEFKARANAPNTGSITMNGSPTFDAQTGQWTACADIQTNDKGTYSFQVRVFDHDGNGTRIEDLLKQQDPRDAHNSRDTLVFPIYAGTACYPGQPDTGTPDTGSPDTGTPDTGSPDTGTPDTGIPQQCDCKSAVTLLPYDIDRSGQQLQTNDLSGVLEGDDVTANFTVAANCKPIELTFAAYQASGPTWTTSIPQTLFDYETNTFGPGSYSLDAEIPACFFQTDLVCGPVLSGTDLNNGQRYGSRKLDWQNGGTQSCQQLQGCTRTRGYWSTHHEFATNRGLQNDWPQPEDENAQICGQSWLTTVQSSSAGGNIWNQLAAQFVAASLNVAAGATPPTPVADALTDAETLLTANCTQIPSVDAQSAEDLKDTLDAFNNGIIGPGHCN